MRTIRISEEVWQAIAKRGRFGETVDDVLRRELKVDGAIREPLGFRTRQRFAKKKMSARIEDGYLIVEFYGGPSNKWSLPSKTDKITIGSVRKQAVKFAEDNGATDGQVHAVIKAMTDKGYHLTK
jgi:hypothetical protein